MSAEPPDRSGETSRARDILGKTSLTLPLARAKEKPRLAAASATERTRAKQAPAQQGPAHHLSVQGQLHQRLVDEINARSLLVSSEEVLAGFVREFVERALEEDSLALSETERTQVVEDLLEENVGVGLLAPLMADPAVTDILMNGSDQVYIERFGRLEETTVRFRDAEHLVRIFQRIAARVGRDVDEASPMLDARLPDGSRVNVTLPPVALDGPTLSIRRFGRQRLRREDLLRLICCRRT